MQILCIAWAVWLGSTEQYDFGSSKLILCLNIESSVCPQTADFGCNYPSSSFTGESGDIGAGSPVVRKVFAHMWVTAWDDQSLNLIALHQFPDFGDLLVGSHGKSLLR